MSLLHGPLNVPSCIPTVHLDSDGVTEGVAAYWADPVTLQAFVSDRLAAEFCWCFTHREEETASLSQPHCLNSTVVNHTTITYK